MVQDKTQFGLTEDNDRVIAEIEEMNLFPDQTEIAKFAMAFAIRKCVQPGSLIGAGTKWHSRGFDKNGEMAVLIKMLYPEVDTPYRAIEYLVNRGLELLNQHMHDNRQIDLAALMSDPMQESVQSL